MKDYKKKYEDALNAARKFKNDCPSLWDTESNPFRGVFEELEDSKDDNIGKHLLNWFKDCKWDAVDNGTLKRDDIIAWLEKRIEKSSWSEEDENGFGDALWAIQQARTIAKDENDVGNLWYAEKWLKSLKERYSLKAVLLTPEEIKKICTIYDNLNQERNCSTILYNSDETFFNHVLMEYKAITKKGE